jgi:hypothetical protein
MDEALISPRVLGSSGPVQTDDIGMAQKLVSVTPKPGQSGLRPLPRRPRSHSSRRRIAIFSKANRYLPDTPADLAEAEDSEGPTGELYERCLPKGEIRRRDHSPERTASEWSAT